MFGKSESYKLTMYTSSKMRASFMLISVSVLITVGVLVGTGYAKVEPKMVLGLWFFDKGEGTIVSDSSGNDRAGEVVDELSWVQGKLGSALEFPGGYVLIPHDDALSLTTFSITAWVKLVDIGAYQGLVEKSAIVGDVRNYYLAITPDGILYGGFKGGNGWNSCVSEKVTDEEWHHVAVTYDMESILTYVDGESFSEIAIGEEGGIDPLQNDAPVTIGVVNTNGGAPAQGIIDEVGIFNDALTEADVKDIMRNGLEQAVLAVEPVGKLTTIWGQLKK